MKTAYAPDNTRSSIVVVASLAIIVSVIAGLIGLSDKPQVDSILVSPGLAEAPVVDPSTPNFGFDVDGTDETDAMLDEAGEPFDGLDQPAPSDDSTADSTTDTDSEPEREIIQIPESEPTPTPEVAAAVEPTAVPETSEDGDDPSTSADSTPGLPTATGSVQGSFFTNSDENEGATVDQNLITFSFAEDGSGQFQGVLDITYPDGTHILLNMSGPLEWQPTNPQVEATLAGAFTLDAPIDADDITADDAKLSISTLGAGSGSLCTTRCFGFTFPPQ